MIIQVNVIILTNIVFCDKTNLLKIEYIYVSKEDLYTYKMNNVSNYMADYPYIAWVSMDTCHVKDLVNDKVYQYSLSGEISLVKKLNNGFVIALCDDDEMNTNVNFIDNNFTIVKTFTLKGDMLNVVETDTGKIIFVDIYDPETDVSITRMSVILDNWNIQDLVSFIDTDSSPVIFSNNHTHLVAWCTDADVMNIVLVDNNGTVITSKKNINVKYDKFIGSRIDDEWYVLVNHYNGSDTIRFDYIHVKDGINVYSRFIKDPRYSELTSVWLKDINNGFLLIAEGNYEKIYIQRFTQIGMPLYPPMLLKVKHTNVHSPQFNGLLYYMHNDSIYNVEIPLGEIPELNGMTIADTL